MARGTHTEPTKRETDETESDKPESKPEPTKRETKPRFGARLSVVTEHPRRFGYIACSRTFGPEPTILEPAGYDEDTFERLTTDHLLVVTSA